MSYQAAIELLNKNLELYLQNKCDPGVSNVSKALSHLTVEIEREFREQRKLMKKLQDLLDKS